MNNPKPGLNPIHRSVAGALNALVGLYRWITRMEEVRPWPYKAPWEQARRLSDLNAKIEDAQSLGRQDDPAAVAMAWTFPAPVNLVKAPNLVRRYVAEIGPCAPRGTQAWRGHPVRRAVGRVAVPLLQPIRKASVDLLNPVDELGLSLAPMAKQDTPTIGVFEQALSSWRLRKPDWSDDVSWA